MVSKLRVIIVLLLFLITWWGLQVTEEVTPIPIKKRLALFPHTLGSYTLATSAESSTDELQLLGVTDYIHYTYLREDKRAVNLYVGFYELVGMGAGYHSPRNCIPGGGWGIDRVQPSQLDIGLNSDTASSISEMIIRRGNEYQVVHYWYQNRGRIIGSEYWEKFYQVLDAIFSGRRDGTFVRIMVAAPEGDLTQASAVAKEFSELVLQQLESHLPGAQI